MQTLLWKSTVLAGVVSMSCLLVWQAHNGITQSTEPATAQSFVPLGGEQPQAEPTLAPPPAGDSDASPLADQLSPLPEVAYEPEPTLARGLPPDQGEPELEPTPAPTATSNLADDAWLSAAPPQKPAASPQPESQSFGESAWARDFPQFAGHTAANNDQPKPAPRAGAFPILSSSTTAATNGRDAETESNGPSLAAPASETEETLAALPESTPAPPVHVDQSPILILSPRDKSEREEQKSPEPAGDAAPTAGLLALMPQPEPLPEEESETESPSAIRRVSHEVVAPAGNDEADTTADASSDPFNFGSFDSAPSAPPQSEPTPAEPTAGLAAPDTNANAPSNGAPAQSEPFAASPPGLSRLPANYGGPVLLAPPSQQSNDENAEAASGVVDAGYTDNPQDKISRLTQVVAPVPEEEESTAPAGANPFIPFAARDVRSTIPSSAGQQEPTPAAATDARQGVTGAPASGKPRTLPGLSQDDRLPIISPNPFPLSGNAQARPLSPNDQPNEPTTPTQAPEQPTPANTAAPAAGGFPWQLGTPARNAQPAERQQPMLGQGVDSDAGLRGQLQFESNEPPASTIPQQNDPRPVRERPTLTLPEEKSPFVIQPNAKETAKTPPSTPADTPFGPFGNSGVRPSSGSTIPETKAETTADATAETPTLNLTPSTPNTSTAPRMATRVEAEDLVGNGVFDAATPSGPQQPELQIEKVAPPEAVLNEPLIYSIIVRNRGGSPAQDVVVEDKIPRGTRLEGTIPQAILTESKKLRWPLGTLDPGAEKTIRLKVIPIEPGEIGSVATVSFAATVGASIRVTAPRLQLEASGPNEIVVGEQLNYSFVVRNTGEGRARDVFLRAILPVGLSHPGGNDLEYEIGELPPGSKREIALQIDAEQAGIVTPRFMVTIDGDKQDELKTDINILETRLRLARTGPEKRFVGRETQFTNTVSNESSQPLKNVVLTETLPAELELTSVPRGAYWDADRRILSWTLGELPPADTRTLAFEVIPQVPGTHRGNVKVEDATGNRAEAATALQVAGFSSLQVDVDHPQAPVAVGEQVSMRLKVRNDGTAPAELVQAAFEIPEQMQFVSARGPVQFQQVGRFVTFAKIETLPVNGEETFDLVLTAADSGDARVRVHLNSAELEQPLQRDEAVRVFRE